MPNTQLSNEVVARFDPLLYEPALEATATALWCWRVDSNQLFLSDVFYSHTGLAHDSIATFSDFLNLFSQAERNRLLSAVQRGASANANFSCQLTLRVNGKDKLARICGGSDTHSFDGKRVLGTIQVLRYKDDDAEAVADLPMIPDSSKPLPAGRTVERYFYNNIIEQFRNELSLLLDSVHAQIWYIDRSGNFRDCNKQANSIVALESIRGKSFVEAMPFWDDAEQRRREVMQVIDSGTPIYDSKELAVVDGETRCFKVDKIPTLGTDDSVTGVLLVSLDITKEAAREKALEESEARYRAFVDTTTDVIWCFELNPGVDIELPLKKQIDLIESDATLVDCNQHFSRICGVESVSDILGKSMTIMRGVERNEIYRAFINNRYHLVDFESEQVNDEGEVLWWQISAMGTIEDNRLLRIWGTAKNVTDRIHHLADMEFQASHDSLTQLPNRIALYREIEQAIEEYGAKSTNSKNNMALLLVDLDRFKEINDTLGHQVGDKLLKKIGPRLQEEIAGMPGLVARLGGDEFAIFLRSIRNPQQAAVFGHRVLDAISQAFFLEGFHTEISASIGISLFPSQAHDLSGLMRYADVAMYRAKKETLGVALYRAEEDPHSPERLAMIVDLRRAIREDQLLLHFQPKVDFGNNNLIGFEVLLRWQHPQLGFVSPGEFIPVAENTGLIHSITSWVLENSLKQLNVWLAQGFETCVSVNLSARNLMDEYVVSNIQELLQRYQVPPGCLELEITESAIMVDPKRALKALNEIHKLGVRLSIDDFGTGYSSLSYLKRLPVQLLKIDFSFVIQMLEDEQDAIIVNSTINLAHNLGLKVVAEGVESADIAAALQEMDCDYAQGYFFGKPMAAEQAYELAQTWGK